MEDMFLIFDILSVLAGVFLIIAPEKAYYIGKPATEREQKKMPKNWPVMSRVIGAVFIVIGLVFIYIERIKP